MCTAMKKSVQLSVYKIHQQAKEMQWKNHKIYLINKSSYLLSVLTSDTENKVTRRSNNFDCK
jgi:hypothetical protein